MKAHVYKPPMDIPFEPDRLNLFLGGSIEMGKAEDWQKRITEELGDFQINIFNPRRDDWNADLPQDPTPGTTFHGQVTWELKAQELSDIHLYYFAADTMSPITLLELGIFGTKNGYTDVMVYVDKDYKRYGNVVITCDRYKIDWTDDKDEYSRRVKERVSIYAEDLRGKV